MVAASGETQSKHCLARWRAAARAGARRGFLGGPRGALPSDRERVGRAHDGAIDHGAQERGVLGGLEVAGATAGVDAADAIEQGFGIYRVGRLHAPDGGAVRTDETLIQTVELLAQLFARPQADVVDAHVATWSQPF